MTCVVMRMDNIWKTKDWTMVCDYKICAVMRMDNAWKTTKSHMMYEMTVCCVTTVCKKKRTFEKMMFFEKTRSNRILILYEMKVAKRMNIVWKKL